MLVISLLQWFWRAISVQYFLEAGRIDSTYRNSNLRDRYNTWFYLFVIFTLVYSFFYLLTFLKCAPMLYFRRTFSLEPHRKFIVEVPFAHDRKFRTRWRKTRVGADEIRRFTTRFLRIRAIFEQKTSVEVIVLSTRRSYGDDKCIE